MFCSKCGSKSLEGAKFCQKCGARLMADEAVSQTTATPKHEPISSVSTITEDTQQAQSNNATKVNGGLRKAANIGRVLLGISLLLLLLCSFFSLPINPVIIVGGVATGTILSALGLKRPLGMTKIMELVVACILLVAAIAYAVSFSGGGGDTYVQMVKNGTLDGNPQNNFVFWNLLETIYNDDSALSASAPQSNSDSGMIGDTQSYNNEFGNIEVTLDYVEFVDQLEDTQTGNDIYPDEDCVFLRAGVTVENVGTEKGGLVTGWNKIVYDSKYEFVEYFNPMEADLTNIKPLSPPKNGALIFTVPNSVAESDKSLVLNINDVSGKPLISYVLRPAGGTITAANTSEVGITENPSAGSQTIQWKAAYANKVKELAAEDFDPLFALINLDDNDIPELVADYSGYGVSVFTWVDETLVAIMENWSYGAMGNHGYDYIPGGNVIRNYNSDQAGAIVNESYMKVNDANELVDIYDETLSYWFFEDTNGNGIMDENEPYSDEPYYYYGNTEITEEKYASYQIPGIYELITGDMSAEEILSQLNDENGTDR